MNEWVMNDLYDLNVTYYRALDEISAFHSYATAESKTNGAS